jgi:ABC-type nitrate/sulfonate/bicarbonate transport system ATPase subunit
MTSTAAVTVRNVTRDFDSRTGVLRALAGVSLDVHPGELVSIVGPSGCGKTTVLRIIQGLDEPTSGEVAVLGRAPRDADVGFVFQQASLFPWWSVRRNIEFGLRLRARRSRGDRRKGANRARVDELIEVVGLEGFADFLPSEISGGMQQRANLARALAIDPAVLLLDEPFSAVDAFTKERLQLVLDGLIARFGTTAVLVTHDIREAVFLGDRVVVMSGRPGRILNDVKVDVPRARGEEFQHSTELADIARMIYQELAPGSDRVA